MKHPHALIVTYVLTAGNFCTGLEKERTFMLTIFWLGFHGGEQKFQLVRIAT
jgi:hypothetical protein